MTAADKAVLDNLVSSPGGVLSLIEGPGIQINTADAPGSAGTPHHCQVPRWTWSRSRYLFVMPANLQLLEDLPDHL